MQFSMAMSSMLKLAARLSLPAVFLAVLALAGFTASAAAQSSTSGAISGVVADAGGARLPGAAVVVTSSDIGVTRTAKANASGEYTVDNLQPGIYTATFTLDGFETYKEEHITVTVGANANISPKLKVGSISNSVDVTAENIAMHADDAAISTTIDQAQIDNLPINGRRWSDFARLTPGVVSNLQGFGLLSFRGISYLLNNNTVDGADDNQAYYSEARGRTRTAYSISPAAIQEFQVNTSNYSAQYGRAAGGVINTITKSGTNTLHGELFFYDRDVDLGGAVNPYTLLTVQQPNGIYTSVPTKPTDWRKQWGFGMGGAILHDKLYWFYTYDQERRNFPGISRPSDPNDLFAPSNATLPAGETCSTSAFTTKANPYTYTTEGDYNSCLIAALYGVNFQAGSAYYTQGLGIMQSFIGVAPRKQDQVLNTPKLDWQINDRNRLSMLYHRMRYSSPYGLYSQTNDDQGVSGWGNDNVKEDFGIVRLTSVINNSLVNEGLVQYGRDFEFDSQDPPLPNELPLSHNAFGAAPGTQVGYEFSGGFYLGANPDLPRYADPDERRLQLLDGITWTHGKHVSKFGLEYNKANDYDNNLYNGNGSYSYDWNYNFIADYLNLTTGLGGPINTNSVTTQCPNGTTPGPGTCYNQTWYEYEQSLGNAVGEIATREYAGYATDDWRITPVLTLTLGVRYEYEYVPPPIYPNPAINGTTTPLIANTYNKPDNRDNIAPRFGFNWNVFGDNKTILRGGFGVYYGRIINSDVLQTYEESGGPGAQIESPELHPGSGFTFPNLLPSSYTSKANTIAFLDSHMRNPQVDETDLALEQNLGQNTILGITYMASFGHDLPQALDVNYSPNNTAIVPWALVPAASPSPGGSSFPVSTNSEAPTSISEYPLPPSTGGYVVYPHGGMKSPLNPAASLAAKVFFVASGAAARPNPNYGEMIDVKSAANSNYNALAVQLDRRYERGLSLLTNITWSHALDENPYIGTGVATYNVLDPTNLHAEYGNSSSDVRLRYVAAIIYQPQTHFHGVEDALLGGWRIAPLVQLQTGLPFTPSVSVSGFTTVNVPQAADPGCTVVPGTSVCNVSLSGSGVNGDGSSADRLPFLDRNSSNYPKTAVADIRLGKNFPLPGIPHLVESTRLEFFAELFNVFNHQNITGLTTEAFTLSGVNGVPTLAPYANFGQYTNSNSNYTYSSRQLQVSARLHF